MGLHPEALGAVRLVGERGAASTREPASPRAEFWEISFISFLMTVYKLEGVCLACSFSARGDPCLQK